MNEKRIQMNGVDITVKNCPDMEPREIHAYLRYVLDKCSEEIILRSLTITLLPDGNVDIEWSINPAGFERIRRITGYLVGTMDRWNSAKAAEEHDRVKHGFDNEVM